MLGKELVAALRESRLDDLAPPQLWSDTELLRMLNYAEVQACRRAHLIIDGTTPNDQGTSGTGGTVGAKPLCVVPIIGGQSTYNLSPKVLQVRRVQLMSMTTPIDGPKDFQEIDELMPGWFGTGAAGSGGTGGGGTAGTVGTAGSGGYPYFYMNTPGNVITFVLAPSKTDTALLVVSRIPLMPFTLNTSPEIDEQYHEGLMDWAAQLAFKKPDSDTINLNLSKIYEDAFTAQFGQLPNAYTEKMTKMISQQQRMRSRNFGS